MIDLDVKDFCLIENLDHPFTLYIAYTHLSKMEELEKALTSKGLVVSYFKGSSLCKVDFLCISKCDLARGIVQWTKDKGYTIIPIDSIEDI